MLGMISRTFGLPFWIAFAGIAAAQETEPDTAAQPDTDEASDVAETCFNVGRTMDLEVLNDEHVYVRTVGGNQYLLTMGQRCASLQRSYRSGGVRIQPYGRRVCPNDGSHFVYVWFDRESVCPIATIERVDDRAHARAIADGDRPRVEVEEAVLSE